MPTQSKKQRGFFELCKHSPGKARKKCPPMSVIEEFLTADKKVTPKKKKKK